MSERVDKGGEIVQYNGEDCKVLKNGALYGMTSKHIVRGAEMDTAQASALATHRHEQTQAAIRTAIVGDAGGDIPADIAAPAAVGAAAGILWRDVVLSPDAWPRDRVNAWDTISKRAGLIAEQRQAEQQPVQRVVHEVDGPTLALLRDIADKQRDVVDGEVSDA